MSEVEALERATLEAWPAARRLSLFGWEHCASAGCSGRVNAVWPLTWTGDISVVDAIEHAIAWCSTNKIAPCFKLADGCVAPPELPRALEAAGFSPRNETFVMTAALLRERCLRQAQGSATLDLLRAPDETIWSPLRESAPSVADFAERQGIVGRIAAPHVFARASLEERPAAIGLGVLTDDRLGLFLMRTAPSARRRGLARGIVHALLVWGAERDAATAYLQVEKTNEAAIALYESEGFSRLYSYFYWIRV